VQRMPKLVEQSLGLVGAEQAAGRGAEAADHGYAGCLVAAIRQLAAASQHEVGCTRHLSWSVSTLPCLWHHTFPLKLIIAVTYLS
jgi:hypothetical protein